MRDESVSVCDDFLELWVCFSVWRLQVTGMGWLRAVGSIQLWVSFAKEPYKRDDILHKRPVILSILLTVATPYLTFSNYGCASVCDDCKWPYGVATISRLLKMIGLFCKRALWKRQYSAKETYNLIDPTDRSHRVFQCVTTASDRYGVASVSRIDQIIGLFCKRAL